MFYIKENEKIVLCDTNKERLQNTLEFTPQYKELQIQEAPEGYTIVDYKLISTEEAELIATKNEAKKEIEQLKQELQNEDYKIIKMTEAAISGAKNPYENAKEIVEGRNLKRARINELQAQYSI